MRVYRLSVIASAVIAMSACNEEGPIAPPVGEPSYSVNGAGRLSVYNFGTDRATPQSPCMKNERHREFDFWVGDWTFGAGNTSRIESILDGCAILEQYLYDLGTPGRSISAYDPDTDQWHQTWVASNPFSSLRMAGERTGQILTMGGVRPSPFGTFVDDYTWTIVSADEVIQSWVFDYGQFGSGSGSITYMRTSGLSEGTLVPNPLCRTGNGANNTVLDFMLGDWSVERSNGQAFGAATVEHESSGCLTTMHFTTRKGYEAIAYTYFDALEFQFFRTYIDSEGERLELRGFVLDGALVLEGVEPDPTGTPVNVRVSIRDETPDRITEHWEVSMDGGQTWNTDLFIAFVR